METTLTEAELLGIQSILAPLAKAEAALVRPSYVDLRDLRKRLGAILAQCEAEKKARKTATEVSVNVILDRTLPERKTAKGKKKARAAAPEEPQPGT